MRMLVRFAMLAITAMAQLPAVGHAQPAQVSPDVEAKANAFVEQGIAAQNAGQYDVAIVCYWNAYQLVPHPALIFNIAQAHRLAGRIDDALAMYQRYLEKAPSGPQASTARELIAELKARKAQNASRGNGASGETRRSVETGKATATTAPSESVATTAAPPAAANREAGQLDDTHTVSAAPGATGAPVNESPPAPGANLRLGGIVLGAAGLVAVGVAIRYGLRAQSLSDELSQPQVGSWQTKNEEGRRAENIMVASWIAAGVFIGAGGVLYYQGYQKGRHAQSVTLAPVVSSQLTGLVVSGTLP